MQVMSGACRLHSSGIGLSDNLKVAASAADSPFLTIASLLSLKGIIGIIWNIARYGLHYMGLGRVWYGAKYSHKVWVQFAHTFQKSDF